MPKLIFETRFRDSAESWRQLRSRRAQPPGAAASGARAATFRAALEQAEDQFAAAPRIGPASRALNLFYGLSQAGRAIAAASPTLKHDEWRLRGHGLRRTDLAESAPSLDGVRIRADGGPGTSFARVSQALHSPSLTSELTLAELWPQVLETTFHAPYGETYFSTMLVTVHRPAAMSSPTDDAQLNLPPDLSTATPDERPDFGDFLARYPSLRGHLGTDPSGAELDWHPGGFHPQLRYLSSRSLFEPTEIAEQLATYRGSAVAIPLVAGMTESLHPLMAWWMVLYSLSMMTRYEPAAWTRLIDVNRSPHATIVEYVLDAALESVPDLLEEALENLT